MAASCLSLLITIQSHGQFTPGRIVVSAAPLDAPATGAPITLREFNAVGEQGHVMVLPASGAQALITGNAADEPALSVAANGQFLLVPGYATDTGGTAALAGSTGELIPRAVGRIALNGDFQRLYPTAEFANGKRQLTAASNGTDVWVIGVNEGIAYRGPGSPSLVASGTYHHLVWANGELFASAADGIHRIGNGAPTTGPQGTTLQIPQANATGFCMNPNATACYVIDGSFVRKWTSNGFAWSLAYSFQSSNSTGAPVAVALDPGGPHPTIYAVSSNGRLFRWVDAGSAAAPTLLSGAKERFTGVAVLPGNGCVSGLPCDDGDPNSNNDLTQPDCSCAGSALRVSARALLSGPVDPGTLLMNDALRTSMGFPLTEPYASLGLPPNLGPTTLAAPVLGTSGPDAIVDWICMEVRSAANPSSVVFRRSVLLQRDGDVVDLDGGSEVSFPAVAGDNHIALRHRNHQPVMTGQPQLLSATPSVLDFTLASTPVFGSEALRTIADGTTALWCGDANRNGTVKYTGVNNDRDPLLVTVGSTTPNRVMESNYLSEDVNLDGYVKYTGADNDRDPILITVGGTTPNNIRPQQLP